MCGIIGYIGRSEATPILIDGLRRLEYRGYDSAGVATLANGEMELRKCTGRIASLAQVIQRDPTHGISLEQIKARKGRVIAVATEGRKQIANLADDVICMPKCPDFVSPILAVIPLQLFAYHLAVNLGCDVDKPRNLAKSVTVE